MITKRNRLAVACLITVAVILLGIAYAQDAPIRGDRAERIALDQQQLAGQTLSVDTSKSMSHFHEDEDSRYLIGPHQTIQDAVDNAKTGDTIILRPLVYKERVSIDSDLDAKKLTIVGWKSEECILEETIVGWKWRRIRLRCW